MYPIRLPDHITALLRGLSMYHGNRTVAGQVRTAVSRYLRQEEERFWRTMEGSPDERTGSAENKGGNPVEKSTLSDNLKKSLPKEAPQQAEDSTGGDSDRLDKIMPINSEHNRLPMHKLQINQSVDSDSNGNIVRRSLMVNIRCDDVDEAYTLYQQLKAKLNSKQVDRKNDQNKPSGNVVNNNAPICQCGLPMVLRQGRTGRFFYGCSDYPSCRMTRDFGGPDEVDVDEANVEYIQTR